MGKLIHFLVLSVAVMMVSGCYTSKTSGVRVQKGKIIVEDPVFAENLKIIKDAKEKTSHGFLHAQVTVQNANRTDFECQYRFEWIRANGMVQKHAPVLWRPIVIHGRELVEFDAVSPVQDAEDFRLSIRRK